ncbi:unnamed protein product, partial [Amoebophrya sp. A25]
YSVIGGGGADCDTGTIGEENEDDVLLPVHDEQGRFFFIPRQGFLPKMMPIVETGRSSLKRTTQQEMNRPDT